MTGGSSERRAENEAVFRRANERLVERISEFPDLPAQIPFICECGDPSCTEVVLLTDEQYSAVRAHPARFLVVPGHEVDSEDRTVHDEDGYSVVEKTGADLRAIEEFEQSTRRPLP